MPRFKSRGDPKKKIPWLVPMAEPVEWKDLDWFCKGSFNTFLLIQTHQIKRHRRNGSEILSWVSPVTALSIPWLCPHKRWWDMCLFPPTSIWALIPSPRPRLRRPWHIQNLSKGPRMPGQLSFWGHNNALVIPRIAIGHSTRVPGTLS